MGGGYLQAMTKQITLLQQQLTAPVLGPALQALSQSSGNVLQDGTGRVITEPKPQPPEPDTLAEACQRQLQQPRMRMVKPTGLQKQEVK
jgi:hypothetical protein